MSAQSQCSHSVMALLEGNKHLANGIEDYYMNCLVTLACRNFSAPAVRCAHMMARGLAGNGCNVDFVVGGSGLYIGKDHEGCIDYHFHCLASTNEKRGSALAHFLMLRNGIINKRWDVIVFYSVGLQFISLISLARRHGIKIVYVQGDHYVPLPGMNTLDRGKLAIINIIDCYLSRRSNLNALTGTLLLSEHFHKQAPNVPIHLSYPPIDTDLFSKGDATKIRKYYGLLDKKIIVYCGSVGSLEGIEVLLNAMYIVSKSNTKTHLVIAGKLGVIDHALVQQIDYPKLAEDLGIFNRVSFTGFIDQNEVRGLLCAADLLIMPKLNHRRNAVAAPIKISEYLASGRPVIASMVGDIATRFQDGVELRFCVPGDSDDLAEKILQMLDEHEATKKIAANGQAYARQQFDYLTWGSQVLKLI